MFREFERVPRRKEHAKYECAMHEENRTRNADSQCLPHDDNRVRLLPTRTNRLGYVNASHLSVSRVLRVVASCNVCNYDKWVVNEWICGQCNR